jgi:hypothetical protein
MGYRFRGWVIAGVVVVGTACSSSPPLAGQSRTPQVSFAAPSPAPAPRVGEVGYLTVTCHPSARVWVDDDVAHKRATPLVQLELQVGRHSVNLEAIEERKPVRTLGIVIKKGETTSLNVNL